MPTDIYTKSVLTVIAVALTVIAGQQMLAPAQALGDGCGGILDPCYVKTKSGQYLSVEVR